MHLLGPVIATIDGAEVGLGGRMPRGVLAALALEAGSLVPAERLLVDLWGEQPPPTAEGTLRAYVSRLRAALGQATLPRVTGGYTLDVPTTAVDALAVADLLLLARAAITHEPAEAERLADDALARWRGEALGDVVALPFAVPAAEGLTARRLELEVLRGRARMVAGRHDLVRDSLGVVASRAPTDEQVTALLMVAAYRDQRQAEALQRFDTLRAVLADTLGIDPGPEVQRIHRAVLQQDPDLLEGDPLGVPSTSATPVTITMDGPDRELEMGPAPAVRSTALEGSAGRAVPIPLTTFVGRTAQLEQVQRLSSTARLLTLTGVGGAGKTRLALESVRRLRPRLPDGPWLIELAGVTDPAMVPATLAQAIGVAAVATDPMSAVIAAMCGCRAVVVLDNCEHVIDAAAAVAAELLGACSEISIVATSREPLGVPGERVLVIPPLTAGVADEVGEAELLFADRAALVDPDFVLDDRTRPIVQRICRALDGIPLAIELAAARLSALSLAQIDGLVEDRFALLGDGGRGSAPRHRTMAAAIDWSYRPLTTAQREVLHAAAVFAGGCDLDALTAVAGGRLGTTAAVLTQLVDKSLVMPVDVAGGRRFRVLQTIRDYCREHVGEDAWGTLAARHAAWMAEVAEGVADAYLGRDTRWDVAIAERDNVRAALTHCDTAGDVETALRICGDLSWAWFRLGQVTEGNRWLDRLLEEDPEPLGDGTVRLGPATVTAADLVQALVGRSQGAYLAGDLPTAHRRITQAVALGEPSGSGVLASLSRTYLAYFEAAFGNADVADELLDVAESIDVPEWVLAEVDMVRGQVRRSQGRIADAVAVLERSRERAIRWENTYVWASSGWILAKILLDGGRAVEAGPLLAEATRRLAEQGDRSSTLTALHTMGSIAAELGRHYEGGVLLGAVARLGARVGFHPARMDPIDGPRQRELVTGVLPAPALERALAEGAELDWAHAVALAVQVGTTPPRRVPSSAARR